jgi:hypothetical protein
MDFIHKLKIGAKEADETELSHFQIFKSSHFQTFKFFYSERILYRTY